MRKNTEFTCTRWGIANFEKSHVSDAIIQPVAEDPVHDDRIPVEAGAGPIHIPCEPSESEKMKHEFDTHPIQTVVNIMRQKAKHNLNLTNDSSASSKTANFSLFSVTTLF